MTKHANLPATPLDHHVIDTIGHEFDKYVYQIRAGDSHRHLRLWMRLLVQEGRWPLRRLIELTTDKEAALDADAALRDIAEDFLQRREQPPEILQSYLICFPKPTRGRGRRETDTWLRDQCIAVCVAIARERWSAVITMTRNDETDAPGICDLMSRMCQLRGIPIGPKRVKQVYDRFAEYLPVHQGWRQIKSNSSI